MLYWIIQLTLMMRNSCGPAVNREHGEVVRVGSIVIRLKRPLDRVKNEQLLISVDHHDYALLVAEAFDHLALCNGEMRTVSDFLRVTPTQLAGIFRKNPMVWIAFNSDRIRRGLRPLK